MVLVEQGKNSELFLLWGLGGGDIQAFEKIHIIK